MSFYLGIDGGQSSTKALIADEHGSIRGRGVGGPCNHVKASEGREKFHAAIADCLERACDDAKLDASSVHFAAACLGFSGGAEDKETYAREVIRSRKYKITHDAEIALSGATEGCAGIVVIAGTGSMAFGRNQTGQTGRAGGWGYIFGDDGSAFDLVRQALRAALKAEEGWGAETALREILLNVSGARDANDLLHRFYTDEFPRDRVAAFAPLVAQIAAAGDEVAIAILQTAAVRLAALAQAVHEQLFRKSEAIPVCYLGGVFRSHQLCTHFTREVQRAIACEAQRPRYSAAAGAVLEALKLDGNKSRLLNVPESER